MNLPRHQDPIAAIATAPGRGAVGIVRVSGRGLAPLSQALCGRSLKPREATYCGILDKDGEVRAVRAGERRRVAGRSA